MPPCVPPALSSCCTLRWPDADRGAARGALLQRSHAGVQRARAGHPGRAAPTSTRQSSTTPGRNSSPPSRHTPFAARSRSTEPRPTATGGTSSTQAATRSARRSRSSLRAQPLTPSDQGSPGLSPTPGWSTFQPAQVVHFSPGLDIPPGGCGRRPVRSDHRTPRPSLVTFRTSSRSFEAVARLRASSSDARRSALLNAEGPLLRASGIRRIRRLFHGRGTSFGEEVSPAGCLRYLTRSLSAPTAGSFRASVIAALDRR